MSKKRERLETPEDDQEERRRIERQLAWEKAKSLLLGEVEQPAAPQPAAKSGPSKVNLLFDEDEDDEDKVEAPKSHMMKPPAFFGQEEEEAEDAPKQQEAFNGDEPDELDLLMSGIEKEHELLLQQHDEAAGSAAGSGGGGKKRSQFEDDDDRIVMTKSDEELLLAPESKRKQLDAVDHNKVQYATFRKEFYIETEAIKKMTDEQVKELREKMDHIKVRGKNCPKPITKFTEAGLSDSVLEVLDKAGFVKPTPIQAQALPAVMSGRDVIGIAKTGSGKTLAYILPMIRHILDQPPLAEKDGPIGLVLVPTRELCMQVCQEIKRFKNSGVQAVALYGGSDVGFQIGQLKRGCEIVVATPGRLIDILTIQGGRITNLRRVTFLVLDEADRMFDLGFAPQIQRILDNVRPSRQAVLFSATFPSSVESLARRALRSPVEIVVGGRLQVCGDVDQNIEVVNEESKFVLLLKTLGDWISKGQILIFADRQDAVDDLFRKLKEQGYFAMTLHGGKDQLDRISTITDFKAGLEDILIATSVAARGLDVPNLVLVINYDVPNHIEDYVHRVGRTGRAGRKGTAITFITPDEERYAPALAKALSEAGKPVPEKLQQLVDEFKRKVEQGLAQEHAKNSGYRTKGFQFTEEEEKEKRKQAMAVYGINLPSSDDEDDVESEGDGYRGDEDDGDQLLKKMEEDPIHKITAAPPIPFAAGVGGGGGAKKVAEIAKALSMAAEIAEEDVKYQTTLEINDLSQHVRYKAAAKESLDTVMEMFPGVLVVVKGIYVQPGRKPLGNEKKMYLEITGPSELQVRLAKREIVRNLKEATADSLVGDRYAKYSVL